MKKDLLKEYVREAILSEKTRKTGPQKWFSDFLGSQLNQIGHEIFDKLPAKVKEKMGRHEYPSSYSSNEFLNSVLEWIESKGMQSKQEEVLMYAIKVFRQESKRMNARSAINSTIDALNAKYNFS
jgi:hypothetical protein